MSALLSIPVGSATASPDEKVTASIEQIKNQLPSGLQMRLPSRIKIDNLQENNNTKYLIRIFSSNSPASLTVSIFSCETEDLSCLVGNFSVDSKNSTSAQEALQNHKATATPITLKSDVIAYLIDGLQQKPSSQFSSLMWEQNGMFYTIQFKAQERRNIIYMAYLMVNETPIDSMVTTADVESKANDSVLGLPVDSQTVVKSKNNSVILDLSDRRVYVYGSGRVKASYPVAIGKEGWETPTGTFEVLYMLKNPGWTNPFTGQVLSPSPKNPLGVAWISFLSNGMAEIGFHGTPNEELIGQAVSHGCVRMRNQDILKLYEQVTVGMTVKVIP